MAKVIHLGSAKPDDPIYRGGVELFSPRLGRPAPSRPAAGDEPSSNLRDESDAPDSKRDPDDHEDDVLRRRKPRRPRR